MLVMRTFDVRIHTLIIILLITSITLTFPLFCSEKRKIPDTMWVNVVQQINSSLVSEKALSNSAFKNGAMDLGGNFRARSQNNVISYNRMDGVE